MVAPDARSSQWKHQPYKCKNNPEEHESAIFFSIGKARAREAGIVSRLLPVYAYDAKITTISGNQHSMVR
jgi:hypothetical protein